MEQIEAQKAFFSNKETRLVDSELRKQLDAIPDRLAFKIGEVAEVVNVKPYVLRYWESEFDVLNPKKSLHNQRMYSRHDVKMTILIKKLLHQDRFSIEGARKALKKMREELRQDELRRQNFCKIEGAVSELKTMLDDLEKMRITFS